jgi:hypothetical protein
MTPADPLAVARSALWGCVVGVRVLARRGTELADQLLELVTVRAAERAALAGPVPVGGLQAEVEDAKFHLGVHARISPLDRAGGELPRAYGRDRLVLMPRDPWTLFAYWEIGAGTRLEALRELGVEADGAREVLRVYDVTFVTPAGDRACLAFDVEPPPGATSAYATASRAGASYTVELGLRTPGNRFLPMARSNTASLPAAAPSSDTTVRWAETHPGPRAPAAADGSGRRVLGPLPPGVPPALPR